MTSSSRVLSSEPENPQPTSTTGKTGSAALVGLLTTNTTLIAWLVFLAFGGGILALYYARIGYMPEIEWSSSVIYLAAASFIGGGVGLLLGSSVLLPGIIWSEFLIFDPKLNEILAYDEASGRELCVRSIFYYLGIPFGGILLISHFIIIGGVTLYSTAAALGLLVVAFFFIRRWFRYLLSKCPTIRQNEDSKRRISKYSFWFTLSILLSQISMLMIYRLSKNPTAWPFVILTLICTSGVVISNHVVAIRYHHYPRQAIAASLVASAVLLFTADQYSSLSEGIMSSYGLGESHQVDIVVNQEGSAIIAKLGLPNKCQSPTGDLLCRVQILSKLGNEYYLRVGDRSNAKALTLPKSTIVSIQRSYVSE